MDDESIGAITQDYEILSLQSEIARLTAQRDRLRKVVVRVDALHDYAGQRGPDFKSEIESDPYYRLQPGDMTSD